MTFYVQMTDKFMSGWGLAKEKLNIHVIECDTREQADEIKAAAQSRSEMSQIMVVRTAPKDRTGAIITRRHYDRLGAVWKPWTQPQEA
jgi:hypothetical protein